jgi:peptidoglycan hydrolase-like protein with peptidoglycan-binding domain
MRWTTINIKMKKLISLLVVAAFALTLVPVAKADQISDLMALIASLQAQIAALQGAPATTGTTCFANNLKLGMTHADVKLLQEKLGVINTGYFGPLTLAAVKTFQTANGVPNTGFVGTLTRAQLNAKYCSTTTVTTAPVGGAMSISLAADNAPSANVQMGSANNSILKLVFVGGTTSTNVTGLTLQSYGTTAATGAKDITAFKLYDETGVQLGTNRTAAGNAVNFVIVPALTIPANGTRTVTVTADVAVGANVMAVARYGLASATSITGGTFVASYPVIGNSFTIVPAGQLGAVNATKFSVVPKTTVKIGNNDVILGRYNVAAGSNEDIIVTQITVTNNAGTISDSDISNLRIKKAGGEVITGFASLSNKKATFVLTAPITLVKGASTNLELIGNIANGNARTIKMEIGVGGVIARGVTSGTNMTNAAATGFDTITIGLGTLTVSMSANHPQGANGYLIKTTNLKTLAAFSMRANGENIILNTIDFSFVDTTTPALSGTNYLSSVGLYDGDSLVSNLINVDDEAAQQFSLNWTIPADTTKELTVKGITNTMAAPAPDSVVTTFLASAGYGLSSGEAIDNTADVVTTAITVYASGKTTVSDETDTTRVMHNQGILAPMVNAPIGAIKIYGQREDMKLTDWIVYVSGTGYDDQADISSVTIYDQDGTTQLSNPIAYDAAGAGNTVDTFTFASSDFLTDIIVAKNSYRTFIVKANTAASIDGTTDLFLTQKDTAAYMKFIGQDSGTAYDVSTDLVGDLALDIASPFAGGKFLFDTHILEVKKASTTPGSTGPAVSRGTIATYAIWDVTNMSSDQAAFDIDTFKITSKTGLPSGILDADNNASGDQLFSLYDGDGNLIAGGAGATGETAVVQASGTVTFTKADMMTVAAGLPKQLILKITTTNTALWPSNTQMQWSIETLGDITSTVGYPGFGGTTWSIPATTNIVTLP